MNYLNAFKTGRRILALVSDRKRLVANLSSQLMHEEWFKALPREARGAILLALPGIVNGLLGLLGL